jgi:hypothetical protein
MNWSAAAPGLVIAPSSALTRAFEQEHHERGYGLAVGGELAITGAFARGRS